MEVSAISSANSFSGYISDEDAKKIALNRAMNKAQKRERNYKMMYAAVPIVAGLTAGLGAKGAEAVVTLENGKSANVVMPLASKVLGKTVKGKAAKLAEGLKAGGSWAGYMGLAIAQGAAINAIANKSDKLKQFRQNHPVISLVGDLGLYAGLAFGTIVGGKKLFSALGKDTQAKIAKQVGNLADKVNGFKKPEFIKNISEKVSKHTPDIFKGLGEKISKFTPEWLKSFGQGVLKQAPLITLFAAFFTSLSNPARTKADFVNEYNKLTNA